MSNLTKNSIAGHNPLPDGVYLKSSKIHGFGLFASKEFLKGFDFGITHVRDTRFANDYLRTPFGGFINHSFAPNCRIYELGDTLHVQTIKQIVIDEELTIDYRPWYSEAELVSYQ